MRSWWSETTDLGASQRVRPDVKILATDISTRALAQAKQGSYTEERLEGIPKSLRTRWLRPVDAEGNQPTFQFVDELKRMILFKRLNLAKPPFPMRGPLDIVFVRNVMFYFDDPIKEALLDEVHRLLRPDGYVIVGKSESILLHGFLACNPRFEVAASMSMLHHDRPEEPVPGPTGGGDVPDPGEEHGGDQQPAEGLAHQRNKARQGEERREKREA